MGRVAGLVLLLSTTVGATVTLAPEPRSELLYSTKDPDCTKLFHTASDQLPFNVTRLRALVDGAEPDPSVRFVWSFKGDAFGTFAADEDLGPQNDLPLVTSMCGMFGNCALTGTTLTGYDRGTILYLAPKCADLGRNPTRPFVGGAVRVLVKAFRGRQKLGKAITSIGFGHNGATTLVVDGENGIGNQAGVLTGVIATYAATLQQPTGVPTPPVSYALSGDLVTATMAPGCVDPAFAACANVEQTGTQGTETMAATFDDDSALCDNIKIVVERCSPALHVDVVPRPRKAVYGDEPVEVSVILHNDSKPQGGLPACPFLLEGDTVECQSVLKAGKFTETKTMTFALPAPIRLAPGRSATVLSHSVDLLNLLKVPANLTDTYTVTVHIPRLSATAGLHYKIKPAR
jgi:hypothetical protein